jgi:hypothetical protein
MRPYQVLILGVETKVGQAVLRCLRKKAPVLKVAVPIGVYPPSIEIPPYLIPPDIAFYQVHTVICCSPQSLRSRIDAENAQCCFIEALQPETEIIGKICASKFGFEPSDRYSAYQSAAGLGFWAFWFIAQQGVSFPSIGADQKWLLHVNSTGCLQQIIEFDWMIAACLFWLVASLVHFIRFDPMLPAVSYSAWRFAGTTRMKPARDTEYEFEVRADRIDTEQLLPDFVLAEVFRGLDAHPGEVDSALLFDRLALRVVRFAKKSDK